MIFEIAVCRVCGHEWGHAEIWDEVLIEMRPCPVCGQSIYILETGFPDPLPEPAQGGHKAPILKTA